MLPQARPLKAIAMLWLVALSGAAFSQTTTSKTTTSEQFSLKADKHYEICFKLKSGEVLNYQFSASHPVDFNLHYHQSGNTIYPVQLPSTQTAEREYRAPKPASYCLMWRNHSPGAIEIDFQATSPGAAKNH